MADNRSSVGNLIDPSLARGFAKAMLNESLRRTSVAGGRMRGSPFNLTGRKRAIDSLVKLTPNLLGSATIPDRTSATIASYMTVASKDRAHGLIFSQFTFTIDPKGFRREGLDAYSGENRLIAIAVPHVLERVVMRLGRRCLDDIIPILRPCLGWAVIADFTGKRGSFSVPVPEGLICCEWYPEMDIGSGVRLGAGTVIKTFISAENMKPRTKARRDALIASGAMDMHPRFPRLMTPRPEEIEMFEKMHAIDAPYRCEVQEREARKAANASDTKAA